MLDESCQTALHLASKHGHLNIVRRLLDAGALAYLVDNHRFMAIHHAAAARHTAMVDILLDAVPASVQRCLDKWDQSRPHWASKKDGADLAFLEVLSKSNALVQLPGEKSWTIAPDSWLPKTRSSLTKQVIAGLYTWYKQFQSVPCTILFPAAQGGHTETVQLILQKVPDIDLEAESYAWGSALVNAANKDYGKIAALLIAAGTVVSNQINLMHDAAGNGHATMVEMLLQEGVIPDVVRWQSGVALLHLSAEGGVADVVRTLVGMVN